MKYSDEAVILYSGGTTGKPKGVMVIQRNMIAVLEGVISSSGLPVDEKSVHFSFLPLAHIMERMILNGHLSIAAKIGFLSVRIFYYKIKEVYKKWACSSAG